MTPVKQSTLKKSWKKHLGKSGLFLALTAMLAPACSSGDEWEEVSVQVPTKGIVTTLEEQPNGEFTVIEERVVQTRDSSRVIIKKQDGSEQVMTLDEAKSLVNPTDTTSNHTVYHHHHSSGLGRAIWWGAMGYMMGRNLSTPVQPYVYRNDQTSSGFRSSSGFYSGNGYARGSSIGSELQRTSVTQKQMVPARSRSGFFRSWGRSSGS